MRKLEEIVVLRILPWLAAGLGLVVSMILTHLYIEGILSPTPAFVIPFLLMFGLLLIRVRVIWRKKSNGTYVWEEKWRRDTLRDLLAAIAVYALGMALALLILHLSRPRLQIP